MGIKIIAEMAWAHDGILTKLKKILSSAKNAGADLFGVHITSISDYMVPFMGAVKVGYQRKGYWRYLWIFILNRPIR